MSIAEKLTAIAENEQKVYDAGYAKGKQFGEDLGHESGYYEGQQAEYDRFWDAFQANGTRKSYYCGFAGAGWTVDTFKPKYDIGALTTSNSAYMLFNGSRIDADLPALLEELGINLDTSRVLGSQYCYQNTWFTRIGAVGNAGLAWTSYFTDSSRLVTIDKLILNSTHKFSGCFDGCTALENITIEGVIGGAGFDVSDCPLTHDSLMSIINALETKTSGTYTVTLGTTNLAKLTDAEKAIATEKGWTLA